jgi:hypothetical protein
MALAALGEWRSRRWATPATRPLPPENHAMINRLIPLILVAICALPFATVAQSASKAPGAKDAAQACAADTLAADLADVMALTDLDRQAFEFAQRNSDPQLGEQRGGQLGVVILVLVIILIVVIVD